MQVQHTPKGLDIGVSKVLDLAEGLGIGLVIGRDPNSSRPLTVRFDGELCDEDIVVRRAETEVTTDYGSVRSGRA